MQYWTWQSAFFGTKYRPTSIQWSLGQTKEGWASASRLTLKATPKLGGTAGPSQREHHSLCCAQLVVSEVLVYIYFFLCSQLFLAGSQTLWEQRPFSELRTLKCFGNYFLGDSNEKGNFFHVDFTQNQHLQVRDFSLSYRTERPS